MAMGAKWRLGQLGPIEVHNQIKFGHAAASPWVMNGDELVEGAVEV